MSHFLCYFSNIISELQISTLSQNISNVTNWSCPGSDQYVSGSSSVKNIRAKKFAPVFSLTHAKEIETKKILKAWKCKTFAKLKDIPTKIIKMNADIFTNFVCLHFNFCIDIGEFLQAFKHAEIILVHNKKKKVTKLITDLLAYCQTFLKFIKNLFTISCMVILIKYFFESMWIPQRI